MIFSYVHKFKIPSAVFSWFSADFGRASFFTFTVASRSVGAGDTDTKKIYRLLGATRRVLQCGFVSDLHGGSSERISTIRTQHLLNKFAHFSRIWIDF